MLSVLCGLPGSGKTNLATQIAVKEMKRGRPVFSNYPIKAKLRLGFNKYVTLTSKVLEKKMFKEYAFPEGSLLIIDEVQNWFNSRFFKEMGKEQLAFFTGHRHMSTDILCTVQHPARMDITLREIADSFIWIRSLKLIPLRIGTEYFHFEDIGKHLSKRVGDGGLSKEYYRRHIYLKRKTCLSYNDKYLKDTIFKDYQEVKETN